MDFTVRKSIYKRILEDFGSDQTGDENAALFLSRILTDENTISLSELKAIISGKPALVCGNAPRLMNDYSEVNFWILQELQPMESLLYSWPGIVLRSFVPTSTVILKLTSKKRYLPVSMV